jgi:cell division protein FtsW (lipid II flippase)
MEYSEVHRIVVATALTLMFFGLARHLESRWAHVTSVGKKQYAHYITGCLILLTSTLVNYFKDIQLQWPAYLFIVWVIVGVYTSNLREEPPTPKEQDHG